MISASSFSFLEEVVVPLSLLAIPGLLAVLLDVVEDELAAGVGKGAALAGLLVAAVAAATAAAATAAATAAAATSTAIIIVVVVVVVVIIVVVAVLRRGLSTGSRAGNGILVLKEAVPVQLVVELEEGDVLPDRFELAGFGGGCQLPLLVVGLRLGAGGILQVGEEDGGQHDCLAELHFIARIVSFCSIRLRSVARLSGDIKIVFTFTLCVGMLELKSRWEQVNQWAWAIKSER